MIRWHRNKWTLAAVGLLALGLIAADGYQTKVYLEQGGNRLVVESGGTLLTKSGALVKTESGVGAVAGTGVTAAEYGSGVVHQTVLTLAATPISVTDSNAYGSTKVYDFPAGRVFVLGCTTNLAWAVTTTRSSTINDNAALKYALGSAAASASTLANDMVDLLPKSSKTLDGSGAAYTTAAGAALAAEAQFDGTTNALDCYLNAAFETATDIDADGALAVNGTVTLTWINLGDY